MESCFEQSCCSTELTQGYLCLCPWHYTFIRELEWRSKSKWKSFCVYNRETGLLKARFLCSTQGSSWFPKGGISVSHWLAVLATRNRKESSNLRRLRVEKEGWEMRGILWLHLKIHILLKKKKRLKNTEVYCRTLSVNKWNGKAYTSLRLIHDWFEFKNYKQRHFIHHDAFFCFFFSFSSFSFSISATYFSISSGFKIYQKKLHGYLSQTRCQGTSALFWGG